MMVKENLKPSLVSEGKLKNCNYCNYCPFRSTELELCYCSPCGACRQFLFEFNSEENGTEIIGLDQNDKIISDLLTDLLPKAFGPKNFAV